MWGTFCYNSRILIFAYVCFSIPIHTCIHTITHILTITQKEDWKDIYQNVSLVSSRGRDFYGVFSLHDTLLYSEFFLWACIISKLNKIKSKERKVPINRSYCLNHLHLLHMSTQRSQSLFLSSARTHTHIHAHAQTDLMEYLALFPVGYETFVSDVLFTEQNVLEMVPCPYV